MRTQISENVIPRNLDEPNRISSTYTTLTLFPHPGPLDSKVQDNIIGDIFRDYINISRTLADVIDFNKIYKEPINVPQPIPEFLNPEIPYLNNLHKKTNSEKFLNKLVNFAPMHSLHRGLIEASETSLPESIGYIKMSEDLAVVPEETKKTTDLLLMKDGSFRLFPKREASFINNEKLNFNSTISKAIKEHKAGELGEIKELKANDLEKSLLERKKQFTKEAIFHKLARKSNAIDIFIDAGVIGIEDKLLKKELGSREDSYEQLLSYAVNNLPDTNEEQISLASKMIDRISKYEENQDIREFMSYTGTKAKFSKYLSGVISKSNIGRLLGQGTPVYQNDREWAFQRTERLDLYLGVPVFRGPISATSVAPGSIFKTSEQRTVVQSIMKNIEHKAGSISLKGRSQELSSLMGESLNHLTESGVQSEEAFQKKSTLLNTLSERRRSIIDTVINQVSEQNRKQNFTETSTEAISTSSYETRGMDKDRSTTELTFQVVSPIEVKVKIEKVGLVWCPYIISPFIGLRNLINRHELTAESEYLKQNMTVDPVEPVKVYETLTFPKEIEASGRHEQQSYSFDIVIPANRAGYKLNHAGCSINFRNGTSKDYDWKERANWDDLENWTAEFTALEQTGNRIHGTAVLSTTDPEYWNKGFLNLIFEVRELSEQSKTAHEQYYRDFEETENRRRAIEVQAKQYARMRKMELIEKYTHQYDLQETLFASLIRRVYSNENSEKQSYYKEILRSCIDWTTASMRPTHGSPAGIPYPEFPTDHFMNTPSVRFTLPIHGQSEEAFFKIINDAGNNFYVESARKVKDFIKNYRESIEDMKANNPGELEVDSYSSEMILGNHLEAVLSNTTFTEENDE